MFSFIRRFQIIYKKDFSFIVNMMTADLKADLDKTLNIQQNPEWHIEGNVWNHTMIVTKRTFKYNNINIILAGIFHDLGKIDTTKFDEKKQTYTAYNHEIESLNYVEKHKNWIKYVGGNVDKVSYIVKNHMRIKCINEMKSNKRNKFKKEKWFSLLEKFSFCDKGGF